MKVKKHRQRHAFILIFQNTSKGLKIRHFDSKSSQPKFITAGLFSTSCNLLSKTGVYIIRTDNYLPLYINKYRHPRVRMKKQNSVNSLYFNNQKVNIQCCFYSYACLGGGKDSRFRIRDSKMERR